MSLILERQIRPVYDALDSNANKSALNNCNKILKKHPESTLVKALKALAIVRMNKVEECLPICDEVLAKKPTDIETLNVLMLVLRTLGRNADLVTMYDEAYRVEPDNIDLGDQAFFANVRTGNWKAAQQIATRLHKASNSGNYAGRTLPDRYLYWSALAATFQADDLSTAEEVRPVLLKLAKRTLEGVELPAHTTPDRLFAYATVLLMMENYEEAAKLFDSDDAKKVSSYSLAVDELRRLVTQKTENFVAEADLARKRITEGSDRNWVEFMSIIEAVFVEPTKEKIAETRSFFRDLAAADGPKERAAPRSLLELEARARQKELGSEFESDDGLFGLTKWYFEKFGDKAVCFEDLRPYIATLEGDELAKLVDWLTTYDTSFTNIPTLQRAINIAKLHRFVLTAEDLTVEKETERTLGYLKAYVAGLPIGANLPATELQPADDFALLCVQGFVSLWTIEDKVAWLETAVQVLEYAIQKSKNSYLIRLHLVRLYRLLSAPSLALQHYRAMRVKQVQTDTLSHFLLARASTFSLAAAGDTTLSNECVDASNIYLQNSQDTSDFIVRAFAQEKYTQVQELIEFELRLDNSLQRDLVKMEHVRMRVTNEGLVQDLIDIELIELKFIFDRTHFDNRDFDVLPNFQPKIQKSFNEQTLLVNSPSGFWLISFLRMYIRVFMLASDIDDAVEEKLLVGDKPKVALHTGEDGQKIPVKDRVTDQKNQEEELSELSGEERALFGFVKEMCDWLQPYHDFARPPSEWTIADAQRIQEQQLQRQRNGKFGALKGEKVGRDSNSSSPTPASNYSTGTNSNGNVYKREGEPPVVVDPPAVLEAFFEERAKSLEEKEKDGMLWEVLHEATITQEAAMLLAIASMRFKNPTVTKQYKFGPLVTHLKTLVSAAQSTLKSMSLTLATLGASAGSHEARKAFVEASKPIHAFAEQFRSESLEGVAKSVCESRKRVLEGCAKGLTKVATAPSHLGAIVDAKEKR